LNCTSRNLEGNRTVRVRYYSLRKYQSKRAWQKIDGPGDEFRLHWRESRGFLEVATLSRTAAEQKLAIVESLLW
jgi:hypothetical protein